MRFLSRFIATGSFVGYAPVAPGTAGSILALFLFWLLPANSPFLLAATIVLLFLLGVWAATRVEQESGVTDNQIIVIDEIVGYFITVAGFQKELKWLAIGLIIFRLFDIVKLYPAKAAEKLPHGWGVMSDDVVAGIYAAITLRLLTWSFG